MALIFVFWKMQNKVQMDLNQQNSSQSQFVALFLGTTADSVFGSDVLNMVNKLV